VSESPMAYSDEQRADQDRALLYAELDRKSRELAKATGQLDARRNIHRYVAFALAGDEDADVQLAADRVMRELAEAREMRSKELAYVIERCREIPALGVFEMRDELLDLRAWATNRAAVFAATPSPPAPALACCHWRQDADGSEWDTDCGLSWCFEDGGPIENGGKFCTGCGKPLVAIPYVEPPICDECGAELTTDGKCRECPAATPSPPAEDKP